MALRFVIKTNYLTKLTVEMSCCKQAHQPYLGASWQNRLHTSIKTSSGMRLRCRHLLAPPRTGHDPSLQLSPADVLRWFLQY
eukprot:CAMPEP_0115647322 /NCGR_PEP_ID=MMETSP0272-20121206/39393_1 /TAXON_ID=71861 /ORGANISM="Scrippsiella trochoidea, Strain CCMP3099" /LENGTH=81 /DNA_ID=CAMNT_0003084891 /DNA_START=325 /DNA_END=570 /DNA_ORIENTATION=-